MGLVVKKDENVMESDLFLPPSLPLLLLGR
jgi:hypothetical protein